jgi:rSAM/selenodomain-associated transferase 2
MNEPPVAVIIPVLNEALHLSETLAGLRAQGIQQPIVVDGGSEDDSVRIARSAGAVVLASARGRAVQMNLGATHATAATLLFLHADTNLPPNALALIVEALEDARTVGGCFRLRFDRRGALLDFYGWMTRFETAMTSFGDQAYFVRAAAFQQVGGFPDWPLLEDVELRRRLKQLGRFVKLPAAVVTSSRRFTREGIVRRQLLNGGILLLHRLGLSPRRLARWYRSK